MKYRNHLCVCLGCLVFCSVVLAGGSDLLDGTDSSFWATFNGTGKKYVYAGEGILALVTYIRTRNVMALGGMVVVSVFINILLKFAGEG
ncbi:MAG: hypothetical protein A3J38_10145 [Gammaproteobacteria bacterium RIFCSPHIGHO2_12_FULL_45_9]|nr:MAG: hypothetical protein A3J38_10145 [Gammaproteobacteria bacterium RIFCSPHIGHO2_12_FULL_45_9]